MRTIHTLLMLLLVPSAIADAQIDVYFNKSVDTSLAFPPGNVARGGEDFSAVTLAELAAAKYSIDMAMYSLNVPKVVDGLIAAKQRGVSVRVVGHVENMNAPGSRFQRLASFGIPVTGNAAASPGDLQPLMHDKFFVIDARAGAPGAPAPVVITGSWNATSDQTFKDVNNLVVIRDSAVAAAYLQEFEEMWGSDTDRPDSSRQRFGAAKENTARHDFTLADGTRLDIRFSPTDSTSQAINRYLASGRESIYTANLTFTYTRFANTMQQQRQLGADVRAIVDNVDDQGSRFDFLTTFAEAYDWRNDGLLHHKYGVVNAIPIGGGSNPLVITGSHNWTVAAETRNDENMVTIFSARIANQFLQEFAARYREVGGTSPFVTAAIVATDRNGATPELRAYPNPFNSTLMIASRLQPGEHGRLTITDPRGIDVARFEVDGDNPIVHWNADGVANGTYYASVVSKERSARVMLVLRR